VCLGCAVGSHCSEPDCQRDGLETERIDGSILVFPPMKMVLYSMQQASGAADGAGV
jgi:hypothetical protein